MSEANTTEVNTAAVNPEQPKYTKKQVGLMIFAIFTCMILTGLSGYKLLPMQTAIMDYFHIAESSYGILNTAASWHTSVLKVNATCPVAFSLPR